MSTEFQISKTDSDGEEAKYEWRLRDTGSEQTAATGTGYASRDDAMEGAEAVKHAVGDAPVTDETGERPTRHPAGEPDRR